MMIDHGFCVEPSMLRASMAARGLYATIAAFLGLSRLPSVALEALPFAMTDEVTTALDELAAAGMLLVLDDETVTLAPLANAFARASVSPSEPPVTRDNDESDDDRKRRAARDRQQRWRDRQRDASRVTGCDSERDEVRDTLASEEEREEKEEKKQDDTAHGARVTGGVTGVVGERDGQRDSVTETQRDASRVTASVTPSLALTPVPAKRPRTPRPTDTATLPVDWEPSAELRSYATERGVDPSKLLEDFKDYWTAGTGSRERRTVSGWEQTWRQRVRDCADRGRYPLGGRPAASGMGRLPRSVPRQGDLDADGNPPDYSDFAMINIREAERVERERELMAAAKAKKAVA